MEGMDITGQRFGLFLATERASNSKHGKTRWICVCDCGTVVNAVLGGNLRSGVSTSCGCVRKERARKAAITHGHTVGARRSSTYNTWRGMLSRCHTKSDKSYPFYGGRGIFVCERWKRFESFLEDMGERPAGMEIDRRDNDAPYEPGNCRWVRHKANMNNMRENRLIDTPAGQMLISEASELSGIAYTTLMQRLLRGWPAESLFDKVRPLNKLNERVIQTPDGPMRMADASKKYGVKVPTISTRIMNGWPEHRWLEPPRRR